MGSRTVPERDSFLLRGTHGGARGHVVSDVAAARFWQRVCYVCIGGSSFCHQGPSHLRLLSPVLGLGPPGLFGGCRAVRGLSAGNLLQSPQGRLQGHIHSVADGFRVVWHRVASALEGRGQRGLVLIQQNGVTMPLAAQPRPWELRSPCWWALPGLALLLLPQASPVVGHESGGAEVFRILTIAHLSAPRVGRGLPGDGAQRLV